MPAAVRVVNTKPSVKHCLKGTDISTNQKHLMSATSAYVTGNIHSQFRGRCPLKMNSMPETQMLKESINNGLHATIQTYEWVDSSRQDTNHSVNVKCASMLIFGCKHNRDRWMGQNHNMHRSMLYLHFLMKGKAKTK